MTAINIDRLTLKLVGISAEDGQRLAWLIAKGLASASIATEGMHSLDAIRVNVTTNPGSNADMLARQIVADVLRQLERVL